MNWVVTPSSMGSSQPRTLTHISYVSCIGRWFPYHKCHLGCSSFVWFIFKYTVQFSHSIISISLWPHGLQHARLSCPPPTPRAYSNSCPLSRWCHPTISSLFSPSPPTFNLSQHHGLFKWVTSSSGGPNIGVSASTSVLPMNTKDWSPLGWTDWISLQSKGLSRVFSNNTV